MTVDIFNSEPDCNNPPAVGSGDGTATANCSGLFNDGGATAQLADGQGGTRTFWIRVTTNDPTVFNTLILEGSVFNFGTGSVCGDPHFLRWNNDIRDSFHGECDMVFLHQEKTDGDDLDVHIRTTMKDSYSFVSGVAVQHGDTKIEFGHDAMYVNGVQPEDESLIEFEDGSKVVKLNDEKRKFIVNIKDMTTLSVQSTKQFMALNVVSLTEEMNGSMGMLGQYPSGEMFSRDGHKMEDFQEFGFEWQVAPQDPTIFMHSREPQLPYERCRMPAMSAEARRRKLRGTDRKLYEEAFEACNKNHIPANVQTCIDDVMFTGELELAEAAF